MPARPTAATMSSHAADPGPRISTISSPRPLHHHSPSPSSSTPSSATLCSLRGGDARPTAHPLKQNPPSIYESDDFATFDDVPLAAPPSALTSRSTHYDPHEESPSPLEDYTNTVPHLGHQRSLTGTFFDNCKPLVNRATTTLQQQYSNNRASFHSPNKSLANLKSTLESTASQPKIRAGTKIISDWFNGASSPVNIGVAPPSPTKEYFDDYDSEEEEDGKMMTGIFNRSQASNNTTPKQSTPAQRPATATSTNPSSKFAWLLNTQKNAVNPQVPAPAYHNPSDELLNLNISQSLFPHGPVDPLAPSSFHDLLTTAENLLTRYQNSYRALSSALVDAKAEQSAQDDELDEAETRVRHLKMQLETMAARATEQDQQMQQLMTKLKLERQQRRDEDLARKRSVALVRGPECAHGECQTPPRRKRISNNSEVSVDSGFESEAESEAASIFSRANGAMSPVDTIASSTVSDHETTPKNNTRPHSIQRTSTYDRVRNGSVEIQGGWGCSNCEGGAQSAVWGRLAKERDENRMLRERVFTLEEAVDGALNVVDGPWGMA